MNHNEDYQELVEEIAKNSPYQKTASLPKEKMSVLEMRKLLGIGKTDSYWLVHKNLFKTDIVLGKTWIDLASFEKWYANQVKYHKVTGEEPGKELKEWSYSPQELAELLGVSANNVYDLLKRNHIETVLVDHWKRIPKKAFEEWYAGQTRYRTKEDRKQDEALENATISMPDMAKELGVPRKTVYSIIKNNPHILETVIIADQKRITKVSFEKFLNEQDKYHLAAHNNYKEVALEDNVALANYRRKKLLKNNLRRGNGNLDYLTIDEAALIAKVARSTVSSWISKGKFPVKRIKNIVRIPRKEYDAWLTKN